MTAPDLTVEPPQLHEPLWAHPTDASELASANPKNRDIDFVIFVSKVTWNCLALLPAKS